MQITFENVTGNDTVYMDVLRAICGNTEGKMMVDLMCNLAPHTPLLGFKVKRYVDILYRKLDIESEQRLFIEEDVFDFLKQPLAGYDVSICSDGIEHVTKEKGYELLKLMVKRSHKQIIFTPLGNHLVEDGDNPESHHSGWFPEDFDESYAFIVFEKYHPTLGIGAFFAWSCDNIKEDFERVKNELNTKLWAKS